MLDKRARKIFGAAFFFYLLVLLRVIVFKYPYSQLKAITDSWTKEAVLEGLDGANFTMFRTIKMYIRYWGRLNSFENLFGNVLAFVPFGLGLPYLQEGSRCWWVLLINAFIFICGIELMQLITAYGVFDVDDILLNCLGAMVGWLLFTALHRHRKIRERENGH